MLDKEIEKLLKDWGYEKLTCIFELHDVDFITFQKMTVADIKKIIPETIDDRQLFIDKFITETFKKQKFTNVQLTSSDKENINTQSTNNINISNDTCNETNKSEKTLDQKFKLIDTNYTEFQKSRPLYQLLITTLSGKNILYNYISNNEIVHKDLARIIIDNELNRSISTTDPFVISPATFSEIVDSILLLFPNEKTREIYYNPGETVTIDKITHRVKASGFLIRAYDAYKDKLTHSGLRNKIVVSTKLKKQNVNIEIDLKYLYSLDISNLDKNQIISTWKLSSGLRHKIIYKDLSFSEVIEKFPVLKSNLGTKLIQLDFQHILNDYVPSTNEKYGTTDVSDRLIKHWPEIAPKVIIAAEQQKTQIKFGKRSSFESTNIDTSEKNADHINALAFITLPQLIRYSFKAAKHLQWKPHQSEILTSFVQHVKAPFQDEKDLEAFVIEKQNFYKVKGIQKPQPFVIFCGPLENIETTYVAIDNLIYKCKSCIEGVDLCFKVFFSLHIDYSYACPHIWTFFHKYVYGIKGLKNTVAPQSIASFTNILDKIVIA